MSSSFAEALILAVNALGTGLLLFVALVVQKVMNEMNELDFKRFLTVLDKKAERSIYAISVSTLPLLAAIPYFIFYGFHHWWFVSGVAVWTLASVMSKFLNLPLYRWIEAPENSDPTQIRAKRSQLQRANRIRAWLSFASVLLMALQFCFSL
jgi:hypothetical protein